MSEPNSLGLGALRIPGVGAEPHVEHVIVQRPLDRVLAFTGRSIHDVVNSPLAKRHVFGFYKLQRWVQREGEISEMEKAWNPLGRRT